MVGVVGSNPIAPTRPARGYSSQINSHEVTPKRGFKLERGHRFRDKPMVVSAGIGRNLAIPRKLVVTK